MILALFRKESAVLAPQWLAAFAIVGLSGFLQMLGTDVTLDPLSSRVDGGEVANFLVFLLSFSVGHTVVAPEFVEGQIEFLDTLPTSRAVLFAVKAVAAVLPCLAMVFGSFGCDVLLAILSPGPPGTDVLPTLVYIHAVLLTGAVAGLGLGMILSWVRGLAWGVVVLGFVVGMVGGVIFPPMQAYVPLFGTWGTLEFTGRQPLHPLGPLVAWPSLGGLGALLSFLLFLGPGQRLTQRGSWATGGVRLVTTGCLSLVVLALGGLCALALLIRAPELLFEGVEMQTTEHFRMLFRPSDRAHVTAVSQDIEGLSVEVGGFVGHDGPIALDVEFLGAAQNHGGVFTGGKIRLRTDADRSTLAHEMAHAHAFAVEGPAAWHQRHHMRFFDEGLASWVASRVDGSPPIPAIAAAIHAVDPVEFDLMVEDARFQRERDLAQAYPLGEAFVAALDADGGAETRACVLAGAGEVGAKRIAGLALWVLLADRCGFDLDTVVQRMESMLDERGRDLPPLPTLEATVAGTDLAVEARERGFTEESPSPLAEGSRSRGYDWQLICRFRDNSDSEVTHYEHKRVRDGRCEIPLWRLSGTTFDYQVGFHYGEDTVFDRWVTAPLP
ncbi:MAG: ABC transporter permease [Myxococcota bacterium]